MPTEAEKVSSARRAFLTGNYFSREGRARLAQDCADQGRPLPAVADIDVQHCLAWQRITCLTCRDACEQRAIKLVGNLEPIIGPDLCSGCGRCATVCPGGAIRISFADKQ